MSTFEELNQDIVSWLFISNTTIEDLWLLLLATVLISVIVRPCKSFLLTMYLAQNEILSNLP